MKNRLLALSALLGTLGGGPFGSAARAQVEWERGTLEENLARAHRERKWVLVELATGWCESCRTMDAEVYQRPEVGAKLAKDFIALRRDGESGEGLALHDRYHVVGFPTLLVLSPEGGEIDRIMGVVAAKELIATLGSFRAGKNTLATLERRAADTHGSPELVFELAKRHALRGDGRAPGEVERVVANDPGHAAEALFTLGKYYYLRGVKQYENAARTLERVIAVYPKSPQADEAPYDLALARHGLGDDGGAIKILDAWLAAAPDDLERQNAFAWGCFKSGFGRDRAIAVAREGLAAHPTSDPLWDTLAELLFAEGRAAEASAAEGKALAIKPADRYYTTQLERMKGAH